MSMSTRPGASAGKLVILAFCATMVVTTAVIVATQLTATGIHGEATSIVTNGAPSIMALSTARTQLRHLEILVDDAVERHHPGSLRAADEQEIATAEEYFDEAWNTYLDLPAYPGEVAERRPVEDARRALASAIGAALNENHAVAEGRLLDAVKAQADKLDERISLIEELNRREATQAAERIDHLWRQATIRSFGGLILLGVVMLSTAYAVARMVRLHTKLLEERAAELEAFTGRVAHDLVSPLAAVSANLASTRRALPPSAEAEARLERCRALIGQLSAMVQDLYEFARAGARPDPEATADVVRVVHDAVDRARPAAEQTGAQITIGDVAPLAAGCRPGVLSSMIGNLIENALKHRDAAAAAAIVVRAREVAEKLRIEVEDNGRGIPAPQLERIFEARVRGDTSVPGLGLGLATVKRLAECHGGTVGVQSTLGIGSTFWFELPKGRTALSRAANGVHA